jgi:hypothetical protein
MLPSCCKYLDLILGALYLELAALSLDCPSSKPSCTRRMDDLEAA